ncbi:GreA/GreB family elongation factor [Pseudomonas putida S11]|nr:GreA/GreB family elongation factor [Pseudomonas putida S11]
MSRAFVNEDQAAAQADQPVERRVSEQPNYVTASGLRQLQERVTELNALRSELQAQGERGDKQRLADTERDLRYFSARVQSAQVVPAATSRSKVQDWQPGAVCRCAGTREHVVRLVGEDEADAGRGLDQLGFAVGAGFVSGQGLGMRWSGGGQWGSR